MGQRGEGEAPPATWIRLSLKQPLPVPDFMQCGGCALIDLRPIDTSLSFSGSSSGQRESLRRNRIAEVHPLVGLYEAWKDRELVKLKEVVLAVVQMRALVQQMTTQKDLEQAWPEAELVWRPVLLDRLREQAEAKLLPAVPGKDPFEARRNIAKAMRVKVQA